MLSKEGGLKTTRELLLTERNIHIHRVYPIGFNVVQIGKDSFYILPAGCMIDAYICGSTNKVKCRIRFYNKVSRSLGSSAFKDSFDFELAYVKEISRIVKLGTMGHKENEITLVRKNKQTEEAYWSLTSDVYLTKWSSLADIVKYTNGRFRLNSERVEAQQFFSGMLIALKDKYDTNMAAELLGVSRGHYNQLIRTGMLTTPVAYKLRGEVKCNRHLFFKSIIGLNKLSTHGDIQDTVRRDTVESFRVYRLIHGVKVTDLARSLGMLPASVYNIEAGTVTLSRSLLIPLINQIKEASVVPEVDLKYTDVYRLTLMDHIETIDPLPKVTFRELVDGFD